MPNVTPSGPIAVAVDALRTLISNMAYFQTLTSTANPTDALASIYTGEVGWPIVSYSVTSGVATFTTREPNSIAVSNTITIRGSSLQFEQGSQGVHTVTAVNGTSFSVAAIGVPDLATAYPEHCFVFVGSSPICVVMESEDNLRSESIGSGGASIYGGSLDILLEMDTSSSYVNDPINAPYEARNVIGQFVQGLMTTQGTGDLMCLNSCDPISGPEFVSLAEQDENTSRFERWRAVVRVKWGLM